MSVTRSLRQVTLRKAGESRLLSTLALQENRLGRLIMVGILYGPCHTLETQQYLPVKF